MDTKEITVAYRRSGDKTESGVYLCSNCHFEITTLNNSCTLPNCSCCENDTFLFSTETNALTSNRNAAQ